MRRRRGAAAVLLAALALSGCRDDARPIADAGPPQDAVADEERAQAACAAAFPAYTIAHAVTADGVRTFGPRPSDPAVARRNGNFPDLQDEAFVALCLVPTTGGADQVWGVPDGVAPKVLWRQTRGLAAFAPPA